MSAYIVAKEHVAYLAAMAMAGTGGPYGGGLEWYHGENGRECVRQGELTAAVAAANMLWKENMISVAHRYSDPVDGLPGARYVEDGITEADVAFQQATFAFESVQVLKACNCLEYQSCEHEEWEASEAYAFLQALKDKAVRALPGYGSARWGEPSPVDNAEVPA